MRRTPPSQFEVAIPGTRPDFDDEEWFYKDVFHPDFDPLPGETQVAFRLRFTFTSAGYRNIKILEAPTHPVLIVHARRTEARHISDHRLLFKHIQHLLRGAGFRLRKNELTVGRSGRQILVAFPSGEPAANFEEILREPQEDLADYAINAP